MKRKGVGHVLIEGHDPKTCMDCEIARLEKVMLDVAERARWALALGPAPDPLALAMKYREEFRHIDTDLRAGVEHGTVDGTEET
jgi:hypothetical protein